MLKYWTINSVYISWLFIWGPDLRQVRYKPYETFKREMNGYASSEMKTTHPTVEKSEQATLPCVPVIMTLCDSWSHDYGKECLIMAVSFVEI